MTSVIAVLKSVPVRDIPFRGSFLRDISDNTFHMIPRFNLQLVEFDAFSTNGEEARDISLVLSRSFTKCGRKTMKMLRLMESIHMETMQQISLN